MDTLDTLEIKVGAANEAKYEPLPPDTYQCQITQVELVTSTWQGKERQQLAFRAEVVEEGVYKGRELMFWTSLAFSSGGLKRDGSTLSPSKLYLLMQNVYRLYKPDIKVENLNRVTGADIKALVGKQLRLNVDEVSREDKRFNKVIGFLPAKGIVPYTTAADSIAPPRQSEPVQPVVEADPIETDDLPF